MFNLVEIPLYCAAKRSVAPHEEIDCGIAFTRIVSLGLIVILALFIPHTVKVKRYRGNRTVTGLR